ncbi:MAG: TIGR00297 family protein [Thermoplasmata archaeon]
MVAPEIVLVTVLLTTALSALAYYRGVLTWDGSVAAFAVGLLIGVFGDILWLFLLLLFLLTSFVATRYKFEVKKGLGAQEGVRGERRWGNVLANGLVPTAIAVLSAAGLIPKELAGLLFVSSIAVAASDTLASELGVLSPRTYRITTLERVPPGTNGGVSYLGQGAALLAAFYTALMAWIFLTLIPLGLNQDPTFPIAPAVLAIPISVGFLGCQVDSVAGATLEERGLVSKKTVNLIATSFGAVLALALYLWFFVPA